MTTSYLADYDWSSVVISGNDEGTSAQPPLNTQHFGTSSDPKSKRGYVPGYWSTSWASAVPPEDGFETSDVKRTLIPGRSFTCLFEIEALRNRRMFTKTWKK